MCENSRYLGTLVRMIFTFLSTAKKRLRIKGGKE